MVCETAPVDYANKIAFLADEFKNDGVQGTLSDGSESIRDHMIALGHAWYGRYNIG
jgi:hypothetical protein